jgi:hypothetical protein
MGTYTVIYETFMARALWVYRPSRGEIWERRRTMKSASLHIVSRWNVPLMDAQSMQTMGATFAVI